MLRRALSRAVVSRGVALRFASTSATNNGATPGQESPRMAEFRRKLKALDDHPDAVDAFATSGDVLHASSDKEAAVRRRKVRRARAQARRRGTIKMEPKPDWLRVDLKPRSSNYQSLRKTVRREGLSTVCEEAKCPNIGECWGGKEGTATATVMLFGDTCTRACRFCAIKTSNTPPPLDPDEPRRVAEAVSEWGLKYIVLTSTDRDNLDDGGSRHIAETIRLLKQSQEDLLVEALVPDFQGCEDAVDRVARSGLDVYAHNVETVRRLQHDVRDRRAGYDQSLETLRRARATRPDLVTKSNIMLGVGETHDEVRQTMEDLAEAGVEILTMGQYLQPTVRHMKVHEYVHPDVFAEWERVGVEEIGFKYVAAGPLVRSSYRAGEFFVEAMLRDRQASSSPHHGAPE